jgi:hypothetical protein
LTIASCFVVLRDLQRCKRWRFLKSTVGRPAVPRSVKKAPVGSDAIEHTDEDQFVSLDVAVSRLIGELTEHRVRQRALLDILVSGSFSWEAYVDRIREVRKRDFDSLFGAMVLQPEAFRRQYADWIEQDTKRYLFRTDANMKNVSVSQPKTPRKTSSRKKR